MSKGLKQTCIYSQLQHSVTTTIIEAGPEFYENMEKERFSKKASLGDDV